MATRGLYSRPLRLPPMRMMEASPSRGDLGDGGGPEFGVVLGEGGEVGDEDLIDGVGDLCGDGGDVAAENESRDGALPRGLARGLR